MGDDLLVSYVGSVSRQRRKILNFVPHPEFSRESFQNDIAVIRVCNASQFIFAFHTGESIGNSLLFPHIKVDEPFNITKTFGPMNRSQGTPVEGTSCNVVGWGYTRSVSFFIWFIILIVNILSSFYLSNNLFNHIITLQRLNRSLFSVELKND